MSNNIKKIKIFAFGGNEVAPVDMKDEKGNPVIPNIPLQWQRTAETCKKISEIIKKYPDDLYIITHGNGPQVGNILLRAEYSRKILPPLPLDVCGADSQGAMGYMIAQLLSNELKTKGIDKQVVCIVTQVVVNEDDPDFKNPTKFIGPPYTKEEAIERQEKDKWVMKLYKKDEKGNEIWRRVVPSPKPIDIVEIDFIKFCLETGAILIAVGGGGIPVIRVKPDKNNVYNCNYDIKFKNGNDLEIYSGVEAVIDKDLASALLGILLKKKFSEENKDVDITLTIFTAEDGAKLNYQKPDQKDLRKVTLDEIKQYYEAGHFPAGSMGPKIKAIINFLENGGEKAYITLTSKYEETLKGIAGTTVVKK